LAPVIDNEPLNAGEEGLIVTLTVPTVAFAVLAWKVVEEVNRVTLAMLCGGDVPV
jgi:hypothetical protein